MGSEVKFKEVSVWGEGEVDGALVKEGKSRKIYEEWGEEKTDGVFAKGRKKKKSISIEERKRLMVCR